MCNSFLNLSTLYCSANTILNFTEISKKKTVTNFLAEKIIPIEIHCRANSSDRDIKNTKIVQIAEQNNEQWPVFMFKGADESQVMT